MKSKVHVQLPGTKSDRIIILNAAKVFTKQLQAYSDVASLRLEKKIKITKLKALLKSIKENINLIHIPDVPSVKVKSKSGEEIAVESKKPVQVEEKIVSKPGLTGDEEKLAQELREIENKIASLG